jgi:flavin-dependent dehydrogenase
MGANKEATIFGAGMSGLIAAVNLAREGYSVRVHDREPGYGGSQLYNPSTHVTPLDPVATSEYIGIDITPAFHPVLECPSYFHDTRVRLPVQGVYAVERGNRPTSLDTLLFEECKGLDITFEFDSPLRPEQLGSLPPNTVIACGLTPSAYKMLDIPFLTWYGWISRGETGIGSYAWLWWDESITEYGYFSAVNNYYFNLLFSIREVGKDALEKYKRFMVRNEGVEHDNWQYVLGAVPLLVRDNPRLFIDGAVLAGTISGAMDPMMWFGISGALVTGKVAAIAVESRERGREEFNRFVRRFAVNHAVKNKLWYRFIRPNVGMLERGVNLMGPRNVERIGALIPAGKLPVKSAIPGFSYMSCN